MMPRTGAVRKWGITVRLTWLHRRVYHLLSACARAWRVCEKGVGELRERVLARRPLELEGWLPCLERRFPEIAALARIGMGRDEGVSGESALAHTQRVLQVLREDVHQCAPEPARALYLAALLHELDRIPAGLPCAAASARECGAAALAREVLFRLDLPGPLRDHVVYLVRSHRLPAAWGTRQAATSRLIRLAWTLDTHLLYLLALADCRTGAPDRREVCLQAVEAFRKQCQRLGAFGRPPAALVPHSHWVRLAPRDPWLRRRLAGELRFWRLKGTISTHEEAEDWLRAQHAERGSVLYLPVGVPGSGKSTWVERNLPEATWVSMDVLRERLLGSRADQSRNAEVYRRCRAMLGRALQASETVVWDAQSHTWTARQGLLQAARLAHAYCIMVYMDVPLAVALERNARRRDRVPEEVIRRSYRLLEEPRPFEAEEIWRVGVDGKTIRCVGDEVG